MVTMPVARGFYVTSPFGQRTGQYAGMHWGTDFGNGGGSGGHPIYAVKDGTVTRAGAASGFGQWITVDHPASNGGGLTVYGHIIPEVAVGATVREGQRIGRINPDSRTNGGVAPHLHLEWHRYVWAQPGADRLDPMTKLAGATWPGETTGGTVKTLIGIDVSEYQNGLYLAGTGVDFCIIRLAYGAQKADTAAVSHAQDWKTTGKPTAFYHYLTPWHDLGAQADLVKRQWEACGRLGGVWIDVEESGITRAQVVAFRDALRSRGVTVIGAYSRANFWESLPGGEPTAAEGGGAIWVSHYGQQPSGPIRSIYPGDTAAQWSYPLGDRKPDLWQWTDRATVPGWTSGVDANAYRGSVESLRALFTGGAAATSEEDDMFTDSDRAALLDCRAMLQTLCAQDMGDAKIAGPYGGWPQTGGRTRTDTLAAIAAKLGVPNTTDTKEK